jgi:DNA-binding NtrC family response regulator
MGTEDQMGATRVLVVDDELIMRESLAGWLERDGYEVEKASSGEEALERSKSSRYDILIVDIKMEGMSGLELLKHINENDPEVAIVMITAYGSISTAIEAMKNGACDYLLKPFDPNELGIIIEKITERQARIRENLFLRQQHKDRTRFESMIGQSLPMQEVFDLIQDVAPSNSTVLIAGETGTGKGLAAKAIHANSNRNTGPFVMVNCGSIPEHLMESELFGYQKGAFTDAKETKKGRLEMAHGGTLFLDEIGEIGMRMQIDLLRVLEDRVLYRVGGTQPIEADFRIIAATNRNLEKEIKEKRFRKDLYYRLNVITFKMPPLRERKDDILLIADHFLNRFSQETNKQIDRISREALDEMMLYDWPGNVRELQNAIERGVVITKNRIMGPEDLPIFCREEPASRVGGKSLRDIEKEHILDTLQQNKWNISKSAKILEIDRSTLYNKLKLYNIEKPA